MFVANKIIIVNTTTKTTSRVLFRYEWNHTEKSSFGLVTKPLHTSLDLRSIPDCDTMFLKCLDSTTAKTTTTKDPTNWL